MDTNLLCRFRRRIVEKTPAATICLTWARFVGGKIEEEMSVLVSVATWSMLIIGEIEEKNAIICVKIRSFPWIGQNFVGFSYLLKTFRFLISIFAI